jgi:hypothetical protein
MTRTRSGVGRDPSRAGSCVEAGDRTGFGRAAGGGAGGALWEPLDRFDMSEPMFSWNDFYTYQLRAPNIRMAAVQISLCSPRQGCLSDKIRFARNEKPNVPAVLPKPTWLPTL